MKAKASTVCSAVACLSFVAMAAVAGEGADPSAATAPSAEKTYTGMIVKVDAKDHTMETRGLLFKKDFSVGEQCGYRLPNQRAGTFNDLRPGEKVEVKYQDVDGVSLAEHIEQIPMRFAGMVTAIDPIKGTMTVHQPTLDKDIQIANGCKVLLRNNQAGKVADVQLGEQVTVTYETPDDNPVARQIAQMSRSFTGSVVALDLADRTVKARGNVDTKEFNLSEHCAIVLNGKLDGRLDDLKPDQKLMFSYEKVNGVNVVTRIGPAPAPQVSSVMVTAPAFDY